MCNGSLSCPYSCCVYTASHSWRNIIGSICWLCTMSAALKDFLPQKHKILWFLSVSACWLCTLSCLALSFMKDLELSLPKRLLTVDSSCCSTFHWLFTVIRNAVEFSPMRLLTVDCSYCSTSHWPSTMTWNVVLSWTKAVAGCALHILLRLSLYFYTLQW